MTSVFFFVRGSFWAEVLICHPSGYWEMCGKGGSGNVLDDLRSDDLAGTAPGSEEVNDHEALLAESGVEVGLAVSRIESVFSCFSRARLARECKRARMCRVDLRSEVVDAGSGRHGGGEVAFVGGGSNVVVGGDVVEGSGGGGESRSEWWGRFEAARGGAEECARKAECRHICG